MGEYQFYRPCVDWPENDVHAEGGLIEMINQAGGITRHTFLKHTDRADLVMLEKALGYERNYHQGLTMAGDWAVSYHRSTLHGKRCYYFRHSAIEYVFTLGGKP